MMEPTELSAARVRYLIDEEHCSGIHESLMRSYHVLGKVKEWLSEGVSGKIALELIEYMESGDDVPRGPKVVCLCGSGRFREAFEMAEFNETLAGKIVLTIGCNAHDVARSDDLAHHKPALDELHLRKIEMADEVLVLNVGGYIGESTSRELAHARRLGKNVRFWEPRGGRPTEARS